MTRRVVFEEEEIRKVMYNDKVFRISRRKVGLVVSITVEIWDATGEYHGWVPIRVWRGIKK